METPLKLSAFIERLNAALQNAFPENERLDMGELHSRVNEYITPLLFPPLEYGTWCIRVDSIYPDGRKEEKDFMILDLGDFVRDKRLKYGGAGRIGKKRPFYTCSVQADTLDEAIYLYQRADRQRSIDGWKERVKELANDLKKAKESVNDLTAELEEFDKAFKQQQR